MMITIATICTKRLCVWGASNDLLDKPSHLTVFCAWDSSPPPYLISGMFSWRWLLQYSNFGICHKYQQYHSCITCKSTSWERAPCGFTGKLRPWMLSILKFTSKYFIEMIFTNDSKSVKFVELKTRENFELYSNSAMDSWMSIAFISLYSPLHPCFYTNG